MANIGFLMQLFGMLAGLASVGFYVSAIAAKKDEHESLGTWLLLGQTALVTLSSIVLVVALATGNFQMEYVAQYTDSNLPFIYKISAFWAGQAGSLLFWAWLVTVFAAIEAYRTRSYGKQYRSGLLVVSSITATFFLLLTCFVTNPFVTLDFMPRDGMGLNPLLQNVGMLIHPPTLYLGFVGFTIVLGHAVASLVTGDLSSFWVKDSRPWMILTWIFLTIGIVLGGWWAYIELGWGGYWAWDPVENASLFPWLTGTAFIHSAIMYERRKKLRNWTFMLILASYVLCIFGTFLTRSGVMDSVHSFGKSSLGGWFIGFMIISTAVFIWLWMQRRSELKDDSEFNFLSREGLFFLGNWAFVGLTFVVIFGTMLPVFSEFFVTDKISVGIPYYNRVTMPFFMAILLLAGVAPLLKYGNNPGKDLVKQLTPSLVFAVAVVIGMVVFGYTQPSSVILVGLTSFSLFTICLKVFQMLRSAGMASLWKGRRFHGAMLIHIGVVIMAYGIVASSFYFQEREFTVKGGQTVQFADFEMQIMPLQSRRVANYVTYHVPVRISKNGKHLLTMAPEKRLYDSAYKAEEERQLFNEVGIWSKSTFDLYLIFQHYDPDTQTIGITAKLQPLQMWVWIGSILMVIGGFYGILLPGRARE